MAFDECGCLSLSSFSVATTSPLLISDSEDLKETEQRGANDVDLPLPLVAVVGVVVAGRIFPRILAR